MHINYIHRYEIFIATVIGGAKKDGQKWKIYASCARERKMSSPRHMEPSVLIVPVGQKILPSTNPYSLTAMKNFVYGRTAKI